MDYPILELQGMGYAIFLIPGFSLSAGSLLKKTAAWRFDASYFLGKKCEVRVKA